MNEDDRELDVLVAIRLLGAKYRPRFRGDTTGYYDIPNGPDTIETTTYISEELPHFSTSIADAWLVVEEMRKRGRTTQISHSGGSAWWNVMFGVGGYSDGAFASDESLPRGICRAALKALGVEVQP